MPAVGEVATVRGPVDRPGRSWSARVVCVVNGRGGVGKTTLANNLAVYARTVDTALPVLVLGLDERAGSDEMFAPDATPPAETLWSALRRGSLDEAIRPGRYGVHYVPSSPRVAELSRDPADTRVLEQALRRTAFPGLVILDAGSRLGGLARDAVTVSDLCVVPVADLASLDAAGQVFGLLEAWQRPRTRARVVLSMLDLRIKYRAELCGDVLGLLVAATRQLGYPLFQSFVARSPRVQALATNPQRQTCSILEEASRTSVHHQLGELAEELLEALEGERSSRRAEAPAGAADEVCEGPFAWLRPRTAEAGLALARDGPEPLCIRHFPFFVGRSDPGVLNDLAVPDVRPWQVSRRHAHFIRREGRIGVVDLGSRLGTWVDGQQLGGPTADPGPVFFGPRGGVLILGNRQSPYAFDVAVGGTAVQPPQPEALPLPSLRAAALAALLP